MGNKTLLQFKRNIRKKPTESPEYVQVIFDDGTKKGKAALFTRNQMKISLERASKQTEDIKYPKKRFLFWTLKY